MSDGRKESMSLQMGTDGPHPDYPDMDGATAARRLDDESLWIRSANLEFYFRYAVVEESKTGRRFVVRNPDDDVWFAIMRWLADTTRTVDVVRVEPDDEEDDD